MAMTGQHQDLSRGAHRRVQMVLLGQAIAIVGCLTGWIDLSTNLARPFPDVAASVTVAEVLRYGSGREIRVMIINPFPIWRLVVEMFLPGRRSERPPQQQRGACCCHNLQ